MRRLLAFLTDLDAKAWRTIAVTFVLFGGVGVVFVLGAPLLGLHSPADVQRWMGAGASTPWAPAIAIGGFTLLAFLGAPQFVLIAAAVVAFGPWMGFVYSWIGNLISAITGFFIGRRFGARVLRDYGGKGLNQFIDMVGRNGFWASAMVRLVPSAPFIMVNMAAGVTPMSIWAFIFGTALGSTPKIALIAFAGHSVAAGVSGQGPWHWASLVLIAALWIGAGLLARRWIKRREMADVSQTASDAGTL
jgi:uncharacterized membrane protein YdjX (TVP38/TMEM64 family)